MTISSAILKTSLDRLNGRRSVNILFRTLLIFTSLFLVRTAHTNEIFQQVEQKIMSFSSNGLIKKSVLDDCIGFLFKKDQIFTSPSCISLISSSIDNSRVNLVAFNKFSPTNLDVKNNHTDQPFINSNISAGESFYIYSGLEEENWIPVDVLKLKKDLFYFSFLNSEDRKLNLGAPLIDHKGRLLCLNNGESYCVQPLVHIKIERKFLNSNCDISRDPFPCQNATWSICDIEAKVGIGVCYRKYDQARCNITVTGNSPGTTGTISCEDCNADWEEQNSQISGQSDYPAGCMTHHVTDWRTPLLIAMGITTGVAVLFTAVVASVAIYRKLRTSGYTSI